MNEIQNFFNKREKMKKQQEKDKIRNAIFPNDFFAWGLIVEHQAIE